MNSLIELLLISLILTNLVLLGSSRFTMLIQIAAIQGVFLGLFPLIARIGHWSPRLFLLSIAAGVLKGVVFPHLLGRAMREANIRREIEPFIGFNLSLLCGVFGLAISFVLAWRLPARLWIASGLTLPVAFFSILTGLFLIIARRKALTQALGYLVLENGIYLFGVSLGQEIPLVVELGVLLDIFVAVFVMGIAIFHISREFHSMDVSRLSQLRDWQL